MKLPFAAEKFPLTPSPVNEAKAAERFPLIVVAPSDDEPAEKYPFMKAVPAEKFPVTLPEAAENLVTTPRLLKTPFAADRSPAKFAPDTNTTAPAEGFEK